MIKIFQINASSASGGGEVIMLNIIRELKKKFQFLIVAPPGGFLKKYGEMKLQTFIIPQKNLLRVILEIKKFIREEKPKILHCHGTRAAFWAKLAIIGLKEKPKLIYTFHDFHIIRKLFL